jgi:hypothetical protein
MGHNPPCGPGADFWVLTTANAAGTNGLTFSQQHIRLYKTVKFQQQIFNLIYLILKLRFDWEYLTVSTNLSCCYPYLPKHLGFRDNTFLV